MSPISYTLVPNLLFLENAAMEFVLKMGFT
jgi:hypothetical protein